MTKEPLHPQGQPDMLKGRSIQAVLASARLGKSEDWELFARFVLERLLPTIVAKVNLKGIERSETQSLFNESLIRFMSGTAEPQSELELVRYLCKALTTAIIDDYRKRHGRDSERRRIFVSFDDTSPQSAEASESGGEDPDYGNASHDLDPPDALVEGRQQIRLLHLAFTQLDERGGTTARRSRAVYLSKVEERSNDEIRTEKTYYKLVMSTSGTEPKNWTNYISQDISRGMDELRDQYAILLVKGSGQGGRK